MRRIVLDDHPARSARCATQPTPLDRGGDPCDRLVAPTSGRPAAAMPRSARDRWNWEHSQRSSLDLYKGLPGLIGQWPPRLPAVREWPDGHLETAKAIASRCNHAGVTALTRPGRRRRAAVLLLTHYFHPEVGAAQTRLRETVAGLQDRGFRVTVVAPIPSYPLGMVPLGVSLVAPGQGTHRRRRRSYRLPTLAMPGASISRRILGTRPSREPHSRPSRSRVGSTSRSSSHRRSFSP